ncbi:MAG: BLUF domain-containing protein [Hyphomonas sp.]|uniref:BLUF domain-containing protein n=1 Tax=Hyphomonas sp. TaxID=87 RepID=UPI0034A0168E
MLVRCLYASRPLEPLSGAFVDNILEQSRKNNPALGITGLLCVSQDLFIQVIEGGRDEVCDLFNAIVRDDRHQQVRVLIYEEISERQFGNWTMAQVNISKLNPAMLLKYFKRAELDPFSSSGQATLSLLSDLIATGAILGHRD